MHDHTPVPHRGADAAAGQIDILAEHVKVQLPSTMVTAAATEHKESASNIGSDGARFCQSSRRWKS